MSWFIVIEYVRVVWWWSSNYGLICFIRSTYSDNLYLYHKFKVIFLYFLLSERTFMDETDSKKKIHSQ